MTTHKRILHVDDNPSDLEFFQASFHEAGCDADFVEARDGEEALATLRRLCESGPWARPDLVLLDLNIPRVPGHDVLASIKKDPLLASIPVVVMSGSRSERERQRSLELGAKDHVVKPNTFEEAKDLMKRIGSELGVCQ